MSTSTAWAAPHLVELLSERAAAHPERLALRFIHDDAAQTRLSYAELHARAGRLAAQLSERARRGERALLLYPNGPQYVVALLACWYAGIIAVPAYPPQSLAARHFDRILGIARDAGPALLLTEQALLAPLRMVQSSLEGLSTLPLLATDPFELDPSGDGFRPGPIRPEQLAMLQYTSGSTSLPKGVMLSHANLIANEHAIHEAFAIQPDDVIVSWLPLFHDMGLIGTLLQPLFAGVSAVLMAPQRFIGRPRRWLEAISRYHGTVSGAPDFAYRMCVQHVASGESEALDLSSWRLAFCGAEPVRDQTLQAFADRFAALGFSRRALYPCYGLAEATLIVTGGRRGDGVKSAVFSSRELRQHRAVPASGGAGQRLVGCGVARSQHGVRIVDPDTGRALAPGQVGEIQVAGPSVARGYWNNPEATRNTFAERAGGVFLRTGDLGFLHDGELFVTGRAKDMIIVRGQNLYPQDIERAVEADNAVVRSGRVVAFALEIAGEEGIALAAEVNARVQKLIEPAGVCREIAELVAQHCGEPPKLVLLLKPGSVPLTSSGKLQRSACRRAWLERRFEVLAAHGPGAEPAAESRRAPP